ncbi:uncharacterized protein LOC126236620 [Schistocerca nitens]|uniref:uncharacterized protein LOC126236620 n=1 Tax=Schistocerca nitens TaxID=7011 RepID=UPI0021182348|nr:uncharacterized protein LOC126236620 [Schistocerca nitens]XP_049802018.1 uncharacterized protein LOC126236620 [Schistocerca nitens]XP_049802019.1 uncharacterized protein LOC126236620 [Schistocerca nitens]
MTSTFHVRRIVCIFLGLCFIYIGVQIARTHFGYTYIDDSDREARLKYISSMIQASPDETWRKLAAGGQACRHPYLEVNNPDIMKFIKDLGPIKCSDEQDWVEMDGSTARITSTARKKYGDIECGFTDIFRDSDHATHDGVTTQTHTEYHLEESDFVKVNCISSKGYTWHSVLAGIRHDQDVLDRTGWDKLPHDALRLNVLMFGFDSLSHNMFIRKMPQSYKFLTENLNAIELHGYNIVGDGTPQALIPILTGKIELELPETRKRMGDKASYVNVYPFLWKEYQSSGYVTAYMEDCPSIGTFTYRLKGFSDPPTDHYMRTYYVAAAPEFSKHKKYCMGSIPRHKIMMNYISHFFKVYKSKPKFMFGFHGELSHDSYNDVGAADGDLLEMMKSLHREGHLNNTVFIIMSDHGHRFADIRNTDQGKQEERLPMFAFVFPPWFSNKYREAMENFKRNSVRLTTPFDINPTLRNVLHFEGAGRGNIRSRSISLFKEIPLERTCSDAYVEAHWCACLDWQEVSLEDKIVKKAAETFVDFLNKFTSERRHLCSPLHLEHVQWAARLVPNHNLLHFRKNADLDGFVPDLSAKTRHSHEIYQLKVSTEPGNGLFEVSMRYNIQENSFTIRIEDVSRINRYGSAASCLSSADHHLSKYCYCKLRQPNEH